MNTHEPDLISNLDFSAMLPPEQVDQALTLGRWSYDLSSGEVHWSRETYALHELGPDFRPSYERVLGFYTQASRRQLEQAVRSAIEAGEAYDLNLELVTAQRRQHVSVRVTGHPIRETERVTGLFGTIQALSPAYSQPQRERGELERVCLMAINATHAGIWHWYNVNESPSWWSNTLYELLGFLPGEIEASHENLIERLHPDDRDRTQELLKAHFEARVPFRLEFRLRTRSGRYKWFLCNGIAEWNEAGRPVRMVGSISDIDTEKRTLEKLRRNESLLNETSELAQLGGWELDSESGWSKWSPEIYRMLELDPDQELHLEDITRLIAYDCRERFLAALSQAGRGEACDLELPLVTAQGKQRWIRFVIHPQPPRLLGFFQDITRRKRTEHQLIEALNRVENLEYAINSSSLVSMMDSAGYLLHVNERYCEVTGYAPEELLGKTRSLLDSGQHEQSFYDAIWESLRQGRPWRGEICCQGKHGVPFWVDSQIMPIYDLKGQIDQFILIENLITERKAAEFKLLRLQEGLKRLNLITSNLELEQGEKISQALRAVLEYFDMSFATVSRIDKDQYELIYAYSRSPDFCAPRLQSYPLAGSFCEHVFQHGGQLSERSPGCEGLDHPCYRGLRFGSQLGNRIEIRGLPYGTIALCDVNPRQEPLCEQEVEFFGIFTRWLASVIERQQFIDDLKKANAGKDQLLQIMAHDLRNPVSSIQTRAGLLLQDLASGEARYDARELLEEIHDIADRAFLLMESILSAKNLNPAPHSLMALPVELGTWLRHVVADFRPQAEELGVSLVLSEPPESPQVQIDPLMFRRVLDNLLTNALKYTPAGGRVEVGLQAAGSEVTISVADTGIGIPEAQLPRLLSESWQLRRQGLRGEASHGLGLSVVQDILSLHSGALSVESSEGHGTRFSISLPVEAEAAADAPPMRSLLHDD